MNNYYSLSENLKTAHAPAWVCESVDYLLRSRLRSDYLPKELTNQYGEKVYWTADQHEAIRRLCEYGSQNLPLYQSLVNLFLSHVLGERGLDWEVSSKTLTEAQVDRANEYLRTFDQVNQMNTFAVDLVTQCVALGEAFTALDRSEPVLRLRSVPPEYIRSTPLGGTTRPGELDRFGELEDDVRRALEVYYTSGQTAQWGQMPVVPMTDAVQNEYGLLMLHGDPNRVIGYVYSDPRNRAVYTAEEMYHLNMMLRRSVYPRGVGLAWGVYDKMTTVTNLSSILAKNTTLRASVTFTVEAVNVPDGTTDGNEQIKITPSNNGTSVLVVPRGNSLTYPTDGLNYEGVTVLVNHLQREIAAALGVSDSALTANMESQTRANTEVAERQSSQMLNMRQMQIVDYAQRLYLAAIEHGIEVGALAGSLRDYTVNVIGPSHSQQDPKIKIDETTMLLAAGLISRETAQVRHGLDPVMEAKRMEMEADLNMNRELE
jgi:hypothetical protein